MIEKFDNFVEEHIAQLIDMQIREVSWKFDYDSVKNGVNKHWHVFCGHTEEELKDVLPIWQAISSKFPQNGKPSNLVFNPFGNFVNFVVI